MLSHAVGKAAFGKQKIPALRIAQVQAFSTSPTCDLSKNSHQKSSQCGTGVGMTRPQAVSRVHRESFKTIWIVICDTGATVKGSYRPMHHNGPLLGKPEFPLRSAC